MYSSSTKIILVSVIYGLLFIAAAQAQVANVNAHDETSASDEETEPGACPKVKRKVQKACPPKTPACFIGPSGETIRFQTSGGSPACMHIHRSSDGTVNITVDDTVNDDDPLGQHESATITIYKSGGGQIEQANYNITGEGGTLHVEVGLDDADGQMNNVLNYNITANLPAGNMVIHGGSGSANVRAGPSTVVLFFGGVANVENVAGNGEGTEYVLRASSESTLTRNGEHIFTDGEWNLK